MGSGVPVAVAAVVATTLAMIVGAARASWTPLDSFAPVCEVAGAYKCKTEALSFLYEDNTQPPGGNTTTVTTMPEWVEDIEIEKTGDATFRVRATQICAFDIASPSVVCSFSITGADAETGEMTAFCADYEDGSTASVRFTDGCSRMVRVNGEAHSSYDRSTSDYNFVAVQECFRSD